MRGEPCVTVDRSLSKREAGPVDGRTGVWDHANNVNRTITTITLVNT